MAVETGNKDGDACRERGYVKIVDKAVAGESGGGSVKWMNVCERAVGDSGRSSYLNHTRRRDSTRTLKSREPPGGGFCTARVVGPVSACGVEGRS